MPPAPDERDPLLYVVDDDDGFRDSLLTLLAGEKLRLVAAESADAFLEKVTAELPGCALVDLAMPGRDGMSVLAALRARDIKLPVIVMTGHGDVTSAVRAMKAGAVDFIEKPFDRDDLLGRIAAGIELSRRIADKAAEIQAFRDRVARLTERERDVFERLLLGKPSKIIAHELSISPRTVELHRAHVMRKLEVAGVPDLIRAAMRAGMIDDASA